MSEERISKEIINRLDRANSFLMKRNTRLNQEKEQWAIGIRKLEKQVEQLQTKNYKLIQRYRELTVNG